MVVALVLEMSLWAHAGNLAAKGASVDLLASVPSVVAVSSTVANPKLVPAHLVDGDPGTAWNSRTGDLVGAWIAVRMPATTRVTAIRMFAGFARVENGKDLFLMNPRIKKVRIWSWGVQLFDYALDPDDRRLQEIAVDANGGDLRIEVIEIVPGTKSAWREICVSELQVWGFLPPGVAPVPSKPGVRVGSLDAKAAHDANTESDLAKIRVAWDSLATGSRAGLAYRLFAEVHDVAYLNEPMCSQLTIDLATAKTTPDAEEWRCLGVLLKHLDIPDHTVREPGSGRGWLRDDRSLNRTAASRRQGRRGARTYRTYIPVSEQDMKITVQVDANGVSGIVLELE
jgi:hypothetical protein